MKGQIHKKPAFESATMALNAICPYYTMFPLDVPLAYLSKASKTDWVLDPFCGRGSTNYAARLLGLRSIGIDSNPVAAAIAEAKAVNVLPDDVTGECQKILAYSSDIMVPEGEFWRWCFEAKTLSELCQVRDALLKNCESPARKALRALLMGILHGPVNRGEPSYLSNQMPRTYASKPDYALKFWKARDLLPKRVDLAALVQRKAKHYFSALPEEVECHILCQDSRFSWLKAAQPRMAWVITSPPYYGMRTYVPDQWLRYWFLGGPANVAYTQKDQLQHSSPDRFTEQLAQVWKNVAEVCAPGARMVVRFGGIHDRKANPQELLLDSFRAVEGIGWKVQKIQPAGGANAGKRQAKQFKRSLKTPMEEIDAHLQLKG